MSGSVGTNQVSSTLFWPVLFLIHRFQTIVLAALVSLILPLACTQCFAQTKRLVIIKCDGLPNDVVDRFVRERDPRTGKSTLPWIDYIFYQRGARLSNFYVRGMSLSGPSWSLLDTGQHLQIKGNVEFDRYTLHSYDYLNFIPYYINSGLGTRIDMPAVEVLDSLKVPLLIDSYAHNELYGTFSLLQRGPRYSTLHRGLANRFKRSPRELFDEWTMGFQLRSIVSDQLLRELIQKLSDPKVHYLDLYLSDYNHVAHHNNDAQSQLYALKDMDNTIGQIWTAIQKSPLAEETAIVLVSDHGFNTDERVYSQGFNLVNLLGSSAGGGHHVITKRRLMLDYAIKGVYPLVPLITTTTPDSYYLKGQSTDYPTALLDFDGNERASVDLRDSDLNLLQILLQQLKRSDLPNNVRRTATNTFFATIDRRRQEWQKTLDDLKAELGALHRSIEQQRKLWESQPKKFTKEQQEAGRDDDAKRVVVQLDRSLGQEKEYTAYVTTLESLLALSANTFAPSNLRIEDVIQKRSVGDHNSIFQLQNYIVGLTPGGLVLNTDGSLDLERSFVRIDYPSLLHGITVKNNVQPGVSSRPIDLIATRISASLVRPLLNETGISDDVVWVNAGGGKQALLLARTDSRGQMSFRYQPISNLTQDGSGRLHFQLVPWQPDIPLQLFEDPQLTIPSGDRASWLSQWHTDLEWLHAVHRTRYSNGVIGLNEELARHAIPRLSLDEPGISDDERLLRHFAHRQRQLIEADMLLVANDHWNFDVRGFNPGGNHGSFFRISTHSTFMIAGGDKTGLPQAIVIDEPYDSLCFVPTLLALTGNLRDDSNPVPVLWDKGFGRFPGRPVKELMPGRPENPKIAVTGANASP